jgi:hypothetical protein
LAAQGPEELGDQDSGRTHEKIDQGHDRDHRPGADVQITPDGHEFTFPDGGTEVGSSLAQLGWNLTQIPRPGYVYLVAFWVSSAVSG